MTFFDGKKFRSTPSKVSWQDFQHNLGEVGWISTPDAVGNFLVKLHWIEIEFGEFDIYIYMRVVQKPMKGFI